MSMCGSCSLLDFDACLVPNHPVTLRVPPLLEKEGRKNSTSLPA
jgi:hypothetical protein